MTQKREIDGTPLPPLSHADPSSPPASPVMWFAADVRTGTVLGQVGPAQTWYVAMAAAMVIFRKDRHEIDLWICGE